MTSAAYTVLGLAGFWLILALLIPRLPSRSRSLAGRVTIGVGVPVLGLLTLHFGPTMGLAALALGVALLVWQPLKRRPAPQAADLPTPAE